MFPILMGLGKPTWESLPVGKLTIFPEGVFVGDQIYGEAQLAFCLGEGLFVRIWSFETEPDLQSRSLTFSLSWKGTRRRFSFGPDGIATGDGDFIPDIVLFSGEDLQGIYWGGSFQISDQLLSFLFPGFIPQPGAILEGNISNRARALGSLFPGKGGIFQLLDQWME